MGQRLDIGKNNECTVIETMQGMVKLIRRAPEVYPALRTCNFSSLEECLEYAERNRFEVNIIHSGRRRNREESRNSKR